MESPKQDLRIDSLISINDAAIITSYSPDFIRMLARSGKLHAVKIGRDWMTTRDAILDYLHKQQKRHESSLMVLHNAERKLI
jgi:excisionase family DNA binding protein